jgi:hypothetical protein
MGSDSSAWVPTDHFARSLTNAATSASMSGVFETFETDPKLAILALTTALVCGNPSSLFRLGIWG